MTGTPSVLGKLMADCDAHGIRLLPADDGGLSIDAPQNALTPDLLGRLKAHKGDLLAALANEWHWQHITQADRDYLLGPRNWPGPCAWCGGWLIHSPVCDAMRADCVPVIPFGKHQGRRADEVPDDYIDWVLSRDAGSDDFRADLRRWRDVDAPDSPSIDDQHGGACESIGHEKQSGATSRSVRRRAK